MYYSARAVDGLRAVGIIPGQQHGEGCSAERARHARGGASGAGRAAERVSDKAERRGCDHVHTVTDRARQRESRRLGALRCELLADGGERGALRGGGDAPEQYARGERAAIGEDIAERRAETSRGRGRSTY